MATAKKPSKAPTRGSGSPTDEYYLARGWVRLNLRLQSERMEELKALVQAAGHGKTMAGVLADLIQAAAKKLTR